jgi:L-asparagine oxygenase
LTASTARKSLTASELGIFAELRRNGLSLCRGLAPCLATAEVAHLVGTLISVKGLLPASGIPTVQCLKPRQVGEVGQNQYSGHYGLGAFPLHTDLAHWAVPPRYFLLRCVVGADDVFTHVLPWTRVAESVGVDALRKAVFGVRKHRIGSSGLLRALSRQDGADIFRWDPLFIKPLNHHAQTIASAMLDSPWRNEVVKISLNQPGDTLVVDNWRMLHGRGEVRPQSKTRHIDRAYLSEVFQ